LGSKLFAKKLKGKLAEAALLDEHNENPPPTPLKMEAT